MGPIYVYRRYLEFADINRRKEVQISRLGLGKVNLNERLLLIKKHENSLCSLCKVRENIKYLLLDCNKENISNILRNTCLHIKWILTLSICLMLVVHKVQFIDY